MTLFESIESFLKERISKRTESAYRSRIMCFYNFLINKKHICDDTYINYFSGIRIDEIEEALDYFIETNEKVQSKAAAYHFVSVIRMYFDYIERKGITADKLLKTFSKTSGNDSYRFRLNTKIKNDSRLKDVKNNDILSNDEAMNILDQCNRNIKILKEKECDILNFNKRADRYTELLANIIIKFLLFTGCKYANLRQIMLEDYNQDNNSIKISHYEIGLPKEIFEDLNYYINIRKNFYNKNSECLFITQKGEELPYTTTILVETLEEVNNGDRSVSSIIKFAISKMIEVDVNRNIIKSFTGNGDKIYYSCFQSVFENNENFRAQYLGSKFKEINWYNSALD